MIGVIVVSVAVGFVVGIWAGVYVVLRELR